MNLKKSILWQLLIVIIITIPSFLSLINSRYFTIHDNQHVVRLYLLDRGIRQGYLFPRWIDELTFGFGDPLFNFYPPLVYYLGEFFHLLGFSYIWSIKLVFIFGFLIGSISIYLLIKEFLGKLAAFLGTTIFTYFFYHAVNAYVRGALSEFFAMNLVPLVFLSITKTAKSPSIKNSLFFSFSLTLVFLSHQLVVLPLLFFLPFYFLFSLFIDGKKKKEFIIFLMIGGILGMGLSAFYWLPMFYEKQFTFLDKELGSYKDHYLYPYQFWYSPWGFGASVKGIVDGMSFQLGKIPILLITVSILTFFVFQFKKLTKKDEFVVNQFIFFLFLMIFGLWMTTFYSSFIWDKVKLLWSLQFPWRFLSITATFVAIIASYWIYFLQRVFFQKNEFIVKLLVSIFIVLTIYKYYPYFRPQSYLKVTDKDLITKEEIQWIQSKTVLHFVPKGVKAKKNEYGVYILDIDKKDLPKNIYQIKKGDGEVKTIKNKYQEKEFLVKAKTPLQFQLNTFNFVGWQAYLDGRRVSIDDNNDFKLINVKISLGEHQLKFVFKNTLVRTIGGYLSFISLIMCLWIIVRKRTV